MPLLKPLALSVIAVPVLDELERRGLDAAGLLKQFGWTRERLATPLSRVAQHDAVAFMVAADQLADDPGLHISATALAPPGAYHVADYFAMFAPTLGVGFDVTFENTHLFTTGLKFTVSRRDGHRRIFMTLRQGGPPSAIEAEVVLSVFACRARQFTAPDLPPVVLHLSRPPACGVPFLEQVIDGEVKINAGAFDGLDLADVMWDHPSAFADGTMHNLLDHLAVRSLRRIERGRSLLVQVEAAVMTHLAYGMTLKAVARALAMSARTLQRRLAEHGVDFRDLAARTRHQLALRLLDEGELSMNDIAKRVGYADATAFGRAFRRLTGEAPSSYRVLPEEERARVRDLVIAEPLAGDMPLSAD